MVLYVLDYTVGEVARISAIPDDILIDDGGYTLVKQLGFRPQDCSWMVTDDNPIRETTYSESSV